MVKFYKFVLKDLDLRNKVILDAAVGAGEATYYWAKRVHEQGGTSKIISIDFELSNAQQIRNRLGKYSRYIQLAEADIFDLNFLKDGSTDIVNCDDTIVFLNPKPLKLLVALKEFHRVLRTSGDLIITSELPIENFEDPNDEGQWRRWNLAKAIYDLKGKTWSSEPLLEEVKFSLEFIGFEVYAEKTFSKGKGFKKYQVCMDEWKEIMLKDIKELPWDNHLKNALTKSVNKTYNKVAKDGYLMNPALYVLKCRKKRQ